MSISTSNKTDAAAKLSPREELDQTIAVIASKATAEDRARIADIISGKLGLSIQTITPPMAAVLVMDHNADRNRDLTVSKVNDYGDAMQRGEWKLHHQGVAFYADGNIADGQHRLYATAVSGVSNAFTVFPNFGDDAFDAIDTGKGRGAHDALALHGVKDGKVKSTIAKAVLEYEGKHKHGFKPRLTVIQTERFVQEHDGEISRCIEQANEIAAKIGSPVLGVSESACMLFALIRGGYAENQAIGFLSALQLGQGASDKEPQVVLNALFDKAKNARKTADRLNREVKMALTFKAAAMYASGSVGRLAYDPRKETLPAPTPPAASMLAAE